MIAPMSREEAPYLSPSISATVKTPSLESRVESNSPSAMMPSPIMNTSHIPEIPY